jgi:hypothetical protein
MNHPVHFKIFYTNDTELVDNLAALLVGEVLPFPGNPLMHTSDSLAVLAPLWGTLAKFGMLALDAGYGFLFSTKEARILDFLSIGEGCKGLQANVNAYGLTVFRQVFWLDFTGKTHIPFAGRRPSNGTGFDLALHGAMIDHFDGADFGEAHPVIMRDTKPTLRVGDTVIATTTFEPGKSRLLSSLTASEKGLKGQINPHSHILQDLRMNAFEGRPLLFQDRKRFLLLIEREGLSFLLPGITPFFQQVMIQPAALFKRVFQGFHLFLIRKESVLKRFTHGRSIA